MYTSAHLFSIFSARSSFQSTFTANPTSKAFYILLHSCMIYNAVLMPNLRLSRAKHVSTKSKTRKEAANSCAAPSTSNVLVPWRKRAKHAWNRWKENRFQLLRYRIEMSEYFYINAENSLDKYRWIENNSYCTTIIGVIGVMNLGGISGLTQKHATICFLTSPEAFRLKLQPRWYFFANWHLLVVSSFPWLALCDCVQITISNVAKSVWELRHW